MIRNGLALMPTITGSKEDLGRGDYIRALQGKVTDSFARTLSLPAWRDMCRGKPSGSNSFCTVRMPRRTPDAPASVT